MLAVLVTAPLCAAQRSAEAVDASIRQLESAVRAQRSGKHLTLLFALRQLGTPSLRPLLYQLVQHQQWPVQVHAVLGLAELSDEGHVDPWLIRQMSPEGHEAVIATALDLELMQVEQINALLEHDELGAMPRVLLLAELVSMDEPARRPQIEKLCTHADIRVSALAAALMKQLGDASQFSAIRGRLDAMNARERRQYLTWLFEATRQYELDALLPWVRSTLDDQSLGDSEQFAGVFALAELGDPELMTYWSRCLGDQPRHVMRIRYALMLFTCAETVPMSAFDKLGTDDPLLRQLAETGRAVRSGRSAVEELIALFDLDHLKSTEIALDHVKALPDGAAARVYGHLIDRINEDHAQRHHADRVAVAVQATRELFEIEPEAVLSRLAGAEDDSELQQALLLGLMDTTSPRAGKAASKVRRIGPGRADSLALLLMAKHTPALDDQQRRALGLIASGGGRVSDVLQIQAAWLYLQHTGNIEKALSRLFPRS